MEEEVLQCYKKAGKIAFEALNLGESLIKKGGSMIKVLDEIEIFIKSKEAEIAFPPQISINEIAAHFCPSTEDVTFKEGDVVKLDLGVAVEGYIADTARTIDLGDNKELLEASKQALENALKIIKPGVTIGEIGKTIQDTITSKGLSPIRNLSGHGLGRYSVHEEPSIPNFATNDDTPLEEDQVIAIEPFATNGAGVVYESGIPTLFTLKIEKPVRSPNARIALREIKSYNGLPFTSRWLVNKMGAAKTAFALREMKTMGMLDEHPPLVDRAKGIVSQFEHTVIVRNPPIIITKGD